MIGRVSVARGDLLRLADAKVRRWAGRCPVHPLARSCWPLALRGFLKCERPAHRSAGLRCAALREFRAHYALPAWTRSLHKFRASASPTQDVALGCGGYGTSGGFTGDALGGNGLGGMCPRPPERSHRSYRRRLHASSATKPASRPNTDNSNRTQSTAVIAPHHSAHEAMPHRMGKTSGRTRMCPSAARLDR